MTSVSISVKPRVAFDNSDLADAEFLRLFFTSTRTPQTSGTNADIVSKCRVLCKRSMGYLLISDDDWGKLFEKYSLYDTIPVKTLEPPIYLTKFLQRSLLGI